MEAKRKRQPATATVRATRKKTAVGAGSSSEPSDSKSSDSRSRGEHAKGRCGRTDEVVTEKTAKELGLLPEEYARIKNILGRNPNFTELSIYSVMWSEHASYKNSIKWLKTLPKKGSQMLGESLPDFPLHPQLMRALQNRCVSGEARRVESERQGIIAREESTGQ